VTNFNSEDVRAAGVVISSFVTIITAQHRSEGHVKLDRCFGHGIISYIGYTRGVI
jgi:hypothetical protein